MHPALGDDHATSTGRRCSARRRFCRRECVLTSGEIARGLVARDFRPRISGLKMIFWFAQAREDEAAVSKRAWLTSYVQTVARVLLRRGRGLSLVRV